MGANDGCGTVGCAVGNNVGWVTIGSDVGKKVGTGCRALNGMTLGWILSVFSSLDGSAEG